ncbi:hypothetical protein OUZ56_033066 [Daphnia magna]|uniref:Uncharacterized protein n=1 Tax=Daphnia magna TaxID=35525 RepID=A0ABQ9ZY10_9CRUS|nr:hypothetical protein OUZ56_033066 [Daphnia magna]
MQNTHEVKPMCIHIEYKYIPCSLHIEVKTHEVKKLMSKTVYSHCEYKCDHIGIQKSKLMLKWELSLG